MNNNPFADSIIGFLTLIALVVYVIGALWGVEYLVGGNHLWAFGLTLVGAIILWVSVREMCRSKFSRKKRDNLLREILSGILALCMIVIGLWPVTLVLYVHDNAEELKALIDNTRNYAMSVDSLYEDYAHERVNRYTAYLDSVKIEKYEKSRRVRSLERRLLSHDNDSTIVLRKQWLATLPEANIRNISTARNLHLVFQAASEWIEEYKEISATFYEGEKELPFDCEAYSASAYQEYERFKSPKRPNWLSILAAGVCILLIFATYLFVTRPKNRYANRR